MAQFTITVPADKVATLLDGFKVKFGYEDTIEDSEGNPIPNPESLSDFSLRKIKELLKSIYRQGLEEGLVETAKQDASSQAEASGIDVE